MLYLNEEAVTPTQVLQHWLLQHVEADPTGEGEVWMGIPCKSRVRECQILHQHKLHRCFAGA
jgi:hypothetical protein